MALAKYAEDNLEMFLERKERKERVFQQDYTPRQKVTKPTESQNKKNEERDAFFAVFAGKNYFL